MTGTSPFLPCCWGNFLPCCVGETAHPTYPLLCLGDRLLMMWMRCAYEHDCALVYNSLSTIHSRHPPPPHPLGACQVSAVLLQSQQIDTCFWTCAPPNSIASSGRHWVFVPELCRVSEDEAEFFTPVAYGLDASTRRQFRATMQNFTVEYIFIRSLCCKE